jgi:putative nucleotidyltransferase with HDIG domain
MNVRHVLSKALLVGGLGLVLTAIIIQPTLNDQGVEAGSVAQDTYKSPRTVTYQSDLRTQEAQNRITQTVPPVYRTDLTAPSQQESKLAATAGAITDVRASQASQEEKLAKLSQLLPNTESADVQSLLALDEPTWQAAVGGARDALNKLQQGKVTQENLSQARQLVDAQLPPLPDPARPAAGLLASKVLIPNYLVDESATDAARKRLSDTVEPVSYTVERDQVIAYRGQVLTDFDVERLAAAGLTRPAFGWQKSLGIFLLTSLLAAALLLVATAVSTDNRYPRRRIALTAGLAVLVTLAGVVVIPLQPILAYVAPVAAAGVLLSLFYGSRFGLIGGAAMTALFAIAAGLSFELFFIHLTATTAAVLSSRRLSTTGGFIRVGAAAAVVTILGMAAFSLLAGNFDLANLPKFILAAGLQGALVTTFVFVGTAFLSGAFGVTTFFQLLELENPRQPLLRRLAHEAPGTYSHSLRIAGWVETLAESVGADPLLARVQALYHDIGKISLPEYFVENQGDRGNLHENLNPKESAEILRAHISEGLALASEYRLPPAVSTAIPEHHGTSLMGFFWEKARQTYKAPREADYRYLGPKPRHKETAILMLADAVEAASRTIKNPDQKKLEDLVQGIMTARIADGQLDETPLQARELTILRQVFAERLLTDFHKRVKYPGTHGK